MNDNNLNDDICSENDVKNELNNMEDGIQAEENRIEEQEEEESIDEMTEEEKMNYYIDFSFTFAILDVKKSTFPITSSLFFSNYISSIYNMHPNNQKLSFKNSSYKSLNNFIKEMMKSDIITAKKKVIKRKIQNF